MRREVVEHDGRRADLAVLDLVGVERRMPSAKRNSDANLHRSARLRGGRCSSPVRKPSKNADAAWVSSVDSSQCLLRRSCPGRRSLLDRAARFAQRMRLSIDGQRRFVAEEVADHRRQDERRVAGRQPAPAAPRGQRSKRRSPSSAITIGAALWARKIATSLATSSAVEPVKPAAHTKISGSDDRSMCFLSSVLSAAIDL